MQNGAEPKSRAASASAQPAYFEGVSSVSPGALAAGVDWPDYDCALRQTSKSCANLSWRVLRHSP